MPWLDSSDEIPFTQFNTAMPEDVVRCRAVEIKVGQHEMLQDLMAGAQAGILSQPPGPVGVMCRFGKRLE